MPDADRLSGGSPAAAGAPLDPAVIRQAARWLVRLHSGEAGPADVAACAHWRTLQPAHEEAWRRAERLARQFGAVPPALGVPVLTRPSAHAENRRALLRTLAVLGGVAPAALLGWRQAQQQGWTADCATATGERRDLMLADGSRLALNTASAVDMAFSDTQRLVRLRHGEIHVQTAAQADARPFIVETPQGRLRALGTRFVVRLLDDGNGGATRLTVLEHRVEVSPRDGSPPQIVPAGQSVRFTATGIDAAEPAPMGADAWRQGVLYADGLPLAAFLAELARHRPGVIRCSPEVAGLRISGAFQLDDTDDVLALVQETLPVQVLLRTRWWVQVGPRADQIRT